MDRLIFHRSDVINIIQTVEEAGRLLAAQYPDPQYLRGYAAALQLLAAAFGLPAHPANLAGSARAEVTRPTDSIAVPFRALLP